MAKFGKPPKGKKLIFRAWRKTKKGTIEYASWYGLKAFPMWVDDDSQSGGGAKQ